MICNAQAEDQHYSFNHCIWCAEKNVSSKRNTTNSGSWEI